MTVADFLAKTATRIRTDGVDAIPPLAAEAAISGYAKAQQVLPRQRGRDVFAHDWDVLVVLDACRWDMYQAVVESGDRVWSVGSISTEWLARTFAAEYADDLANTAYVTANPFSERSSALDDVQLAFLDEVWRDAWDHDQGTVPAQPVLDRGLHAAHQNYDRVIIHFMQPHFPFIGASEQHSAMNLSSFGQGNDLSGQNLWGRVKRGEVDPETAIDAYHDNLRYVMRFVRVLLENVDGRVVVTADHGNALGEWGLWGHRANMPIAPMRAVPWDGYTCTNQETYDPTTADSQNATGTQEGPTSDQSVTDRLQALGYREEGS